MNSLLPRLLLKCASPSNNFKCRDDLIILSDFNHVSFLLKCLTSLRSIIYRTGLIQFLPCHVDSGAVSSSGQFMLSWPICISSWRWWVIPLPPVEYVLQPLGFSIWSIISWAGFSVVFPVPCFPDDYPFFIESSDWATPLLIPGLCLSWNFILH